MKNSIERPLTLGDLKVGDRFKKVGGRKLGVWTVVGEVDPVRIAKRQIQYESGARPVKVHCTLKVAKQ